MRSVPNWLIVVLAIVIGWYVYNHNAGFTPETTLSSGLVVSSH